jgi:DNA N-6-adenine-methyltransferase (Dam)
MPDPRERTVGTSVEWYTPPEVFAALGLRFDLDPASPVGGLPWVPAKRQLSVLDHGLSTPWFGRVWLNPPYGRGMDRWMTRLADHGDGLALVFNRSDTRWWHDAVPRATAVCFIYRRLRFIRPDGSIGCNSPAPSLLLAFGLPCALALAASGLGYTLALPQVARRREP